ncbi:MAG: PepSY-associated TM helix domain-containing protein [Methylococcales bacterium]|nr:PepSY-associated TM helix domain-containing protein [Methylococcales bacterium]
MQHLFKPRHLIRSLHLALALTVGTLFMILGLTGSVNVFMTELEELGLPPVSQAAARADLDRILLEVKARHPDKNHGWTLTLPGHDRDYLWLEYLRPKETEGELYAPLRVLVNPNSGEIVSETFWGRTVWSLIYEIHADLLLGKFDATLGRTALKTICFSGLLIIAGLVSGLWLWWPKQGNFGKALTIKTKTSWARRLYDIHKTAGLAGFILLLVISFTGFAFAYADEIESVVTVFSDVQARRNRPPPDLSSHGEGAMIGIEQVLTIAARTFPEARPRRIRTPANAGGVYAVESRQPGEANDRAPRSRVFIDAYSGTILATENPRQFTAGETFMNLLWPLHSGEALGLPGRIIWALSGFLPATLWLTGLLRWRQKARPPV